MVTCILSVLTTLGTGKVGFPPCHPVSCWLLRVFSVKPDSAMDFHDDENCNDFNMR
jgi:hypothetical protein